ncbi:TPA: hypothetical protein DCZ15_03255 [Candidatus Falkowbacteria bacterium]|nr:MAG: hypothetical protein UV95_C0002G0038 [Candidatus Falkowbacteria bacterium GW2011_GWF2_43_32]HBA36867.1 hypothetical protein [Candidatus Falkowbacteria bacterium]
MKKSRIFILFMAAAISLTACYKNWTTETKQAYEFSRLERELICHPEKLVRVQIIVQEEWNSEPLLIVPQKISRLFGYPPLYSIEITVPLEEYGPEYSLSLISCENRITALINYFGNNFRQSYPYAQGKLPEISHLREISDHGNKNGGNEEEEDEEKKKLEALCLAYKIVKRI